MKPDSHERITRSAIDIYRETEHTRFSSILEDSRLKSAIVDGSVNEDNLSFERLTNWHFYPSNQKLQQQNEVECYKLNVTPTSSKIIKKKQKQLKSEVKIGISCQLFEVFGRILHHIQDMSTPSHVVPVYHSFGKKKDEYEVYLIEEADSVFKKMLEERNNIASVFSENQENDFFTLYNKAANRSLAHLKSDKTKFEYTLNGQQEQGDPSLFWLPYSPSDVEANNLNPCKVEGFGRFGLLGKSYGLTNINIDGKKFLVKERIYIELATDMISMATRDTLRAMMLLETWIDDNFRDKEDPL